MYRLSIHRSYLCAERIWWDKFYGCNSSPDFIYAVHPSRCNTGTDLMQVELCMVRITVEL